MSNKSNTNIERIIAKIDNDFNPDNSDWIPRIGAWCIDAMSMLNVTPKEKKKIKVPVKDRIAITNCPINDTRIVVYDENGCKIKEAGDKQCGCCSSFTGEKPRGAEQSVAEITNTTGVIVSKANYNYAEKEKNYVILDCNKIEINWDADSICIELEVIKTQKSFIYDCDFPAIPNNGLLIEAIVYYCMYKMLCRGYKHPVFNLAASQYGTNPYYMWTKLKDEAERSVRINAQGDILDDGGIWKSAFFINTFDPRK